ncbi:single-stranded DNA-binding protein [Bacillus paralicheniformis]|uniref:single-stranded DNA-binding protein n=1 Tax=Bacillus paralicheniformis TaxID=1648923 RepID=UPI003A8A61D4
MINDVVLVGRLTRDPELRYTPNGDAVATFTLAVNRSFTNQQGEREADFINCVVWKRRAENVANYLKKGSLAGVVGSIRTRNYENQQGQRVFVTEVHANDVQFLEPKGSGNGGAPNYNQNQNNNQSSGGFGQNSGTGGQQNGYNGAGRAEAPPNNNPFGEDPFASNGKPIDISDDDLPF